MPPETPPSPDPVAKSSRGLERDETSELLDRLRNDSREGWAEVLDRVESKLRVLLHFRMSGVLRAFCEPEDLLQEVWAEAMENLDRFEYRGDGSLQKWLAGILRMKLLEAARRVDSPHAPVSLSTRLPSEASSSAQPVDLTNALRQKHAGVSTNVIRHDLEHRVQEALLLLPEREREILVLRIYEGLNGRETARRMGVDEGTVSLSYARALERCSAHLREFES